MGECSIIIIILLLLTKRGIGHTITVFYNPLVSWIYNNHIIGLRELYECLPSPSGAV